MAKRRLMALPGLVMLVALGGPISTDAADAAPAAPAPPIQSVSVDGVPYSLDVIIVFSHDRGGRW
jgi:hypothetical protein